MRVNIFRNFISIGNGCEELGRWKIKGLSHDSPNTLYKNIMNLFSEQDSFRHLSAEMPLSPFRLQRYGVNGFCAIPKNSHFQSVTVAFSCLRHKKRATSMY